MRPPLNGNILITGASSGIGLALARELAPEAGVLILVARREDRLEALAEELRASRAGLAVHVMAADLLDHAQIDALLARIGAEVGDVDILVNNAGMGDIGMFDLAKWEKTARMLELNVTALTYLTQRLVPGMVTRRRGGILQVSSGFGLQFMPGFAAYVGTKHYVTGFSESLRCEVGPEGVVVSQLCPGPVATEFEAVAKDFEGPEIPTWAMISAERCARETVRGFRRGKAIIVPGFAMKLIMGMGGMTPRFVLRFIYGIVGKQLRAEQVKALAAQAGG